MNPDRDMIEVCNSALSRMPNLPAYIENGSSAYYMPKEDLVNLPLIETFKPSRAMLGPNFMNTVMQKGHESRLNHPGMLTVAAFGGKNTASRSLGRVN